jgi:rhamnogalacturonyl hydrolase YesR
MIKLFLPFLLSTSFASLVTTAQQKANDVTAPLHAMQPAYETPYTVPTQQTVMQILDKVFGYLDTVTPPLFMNRVTHQPVSDITRPDTNIIFTPGDFRLTSYEWGVTYAGMLSVTEATGDNKFADYTKQRLELIAQAAPFFNSLYKENPTPSNPLRQVVSPKALDDAGAVCAANIRLLRSGGSSRLRPVIDNYMNFISTGQFRLTDGTLARNRPQKNTLWLDDLFMSVPALAQMGKLTGDIKYFDDAVKQVIRFSERMFNKNQGIYMHGWVEDMKEHPEFHWARANGWALMAMTELLDLLPANHPGREKILQQLRLHIRGLAPLQSGKGFWHQLLDKTDSYLETSATAIYTYCIAKAINKNGSMQKPMHPWCCLPGTLFQQRSMTGDRLRGPV